MNPFDGLTKLFTSKVDGFAPMDDKFVRPDRDATAKSMKLADRGCEQGELNLPPADSDDFDVVEREIISEVSEHLDNAHIDACNHLRAYESRLADLHLLHGLGAIRSETAKTLGNIKKAVKDWHDRLALREDGVRASYEELRQFRKANDLKRPFHKVESPWVHGSIILGAWFAETAGNTLFLSENNSMGIIGGIVAAAFVAVINVALAVSAGVFIARRKNLPGQGAKISAWIGLALWLLLTLVWNLTAGHFRDAQSGGLADPQSAAITMVSTHPFGFTSFYSWGMLIIGLLAALISAYEAYGMDDPFPGYGKLGRQHEERCDEYADLVSEARENLSDERDAAIDAAQKVKDELTVQLHARGRIHAAHSHLMRRYAEHHGQMEDLVNFLLKTYRDANIKCRTDGQRPPHFDRPFSFADKRLPDIHEEPVDRQEIQRHELELNNGVDRVTKAFDEGIDSFKPLDTLKKDLNDGAL